MVRVDNKKKHDQNCDPICDHVCRNAGRKFGRDATGPSFATEIAATFATTPVATVATVCGRDGKVCVARGTSVATRAVMHAAKKTRPALRPMLRPYRSQCWSYSVCALVVAHAATNVATAPAVDAFACVVSNINRPNLSPTRDRVCDES